MAKFNTTRKAPKKRLVITTKKPKLPKVCGQLEKVGEQKEGLLRPSKYHKKLQSDIQKTIN